MSLQSRKELLGRIQNRYEEASWKEKGKILDEFISITGYGRKYAIYSLNQKNTKINDREKEKILKKRKYDGEVPLALLDPKVRKLRFAATCVCLTTINDFNA